MGNLKINIDRYMELKGIKNYSCLLADIARELGIKGQEAYAFAYKEKSNFSKMLKGERPLKYDFIIPLEKIFGVSLARLLYEDAYKLPVEKGNIPFDKGFRYYAYLDDPKLYKDEFDVLLANDGRSILNQTDEFGKTFLDYVVEYQSVNGVRYLHDEYGIKVKMWPNLFDFKKDKETIWIRFEKWIEFARFVANMDDPELFNDIFDSRYMFFRGGHYYIEGSIFCRDEYLEILLDNDDLFRSMFEIIPYEVNRGNIAKRRKQAESITYSTINPIINSCLRYALKHLDKYRHRAADILKFGIEHNYKIISKFDNYNEYYICDEFGGLSHIENKDYFDIVIFVDTEVNDDKIMPLIDQLPKFNTGDKWRVQS